jgi:hypothetical protein
MKISKILYALLVATVFAGCGGGGADSSVGASPFEGKYDGEIFPVEKMRSEGGSPLMVVIDSLNVDAKGDIIGLAATLSGDKWVSRELTGHIAPYGILKIASPAFRASGTVMRVLEKAGSEGGQAPVLQGSVTVYPTKGPEYKANISLYSGNLPD